MKFNDADIDAGNCHFRIKNLDFVKFTYIKNNNVNFITKTAF